MKMVLYKDVIAGKTVWYDWRFRRFFISEELDQRFIDEGIRGFRLPNGSLGRSLHAGEALR